MPFMLKYHFDLGVDRVFAVDNGSTDGTVELLLADERIHVWQTGETLYRQDTWRDLIMRRFGKGQWWLSLDPDELFLYPHMDQIPLSGLLGHLDREGFTALHVVLLDLYPDGPIARTRIAAGEDPRSLSPWFDPPAFRQTPHPFVRCRGATDFVLTGGVRKRVFGLESCCSKFPLVKYGSGMFIPRGIHTIEGAHIADLHGAILHFKFLGEFQAKAERESGRGQYWMAAAEYKRFAEVLQGRQNLVLRDGDSLRYESPGQLIERGVLQTSPTYSALCTR